MSSGFWQTLAMEPPFRLFVRAWLKHSQAPAKTRALWELSERPAYLLGVLTAAEQALKEKALEIAVVEFGVAGLKPGSCWSRGPARSSVRIKCIH